MQRPCTSNIFVDPHPCSTEFQVHQPRMKVFTVGLDDKEKVQKVNMEKAEPTKVATEVPPLMPPVIVPRAVPRRRFGCGVLSWVVAAFFIVLLCLTISEITYNRQRDQAFLRLKWAELRQRMLGFELLSQAQQQEAQPQIQFQQQPINELPAFSRRNDLAVEDMGTTTTVPSNPPSTEKSADTSTETNNDGISARFDLLRMLLSKMRENAAEMGLTGDMQVHVIEVKPLPNKMPQQSIDDAFGEIAMPRQAFGQWRSEEENNEMGNRIDSPWQFDRESSRPAPWVRPFERMNRWDGHQWGQENRWPQENHIFEPFQDVPEEEPQMRITHHYGKDSQTPQRVVTELFGNTAPEVIGHMLGQKNAQAQLQLQQQQQQAMMQQQQQQQPWSQPWAQAPAQPWPQPWAPQPQMWDQPHWDQPAIAQPVPPMIYFFNPIQQQPLPPPPFQPTIANQNQFPLPVQNQAPILPQPFSIDNNNNLNPLNENPAKPWYMGGDDQRWQQAWENNNKVDAPFNPHPTAASPAFVDNTAAVEQQHVAPQSIPEQPTGHDSDGIDGFPREVS
ncbi:hypothetical protein GCK32_007417 [Trichostrongylus colubriformis]|uniref:Uncharacterized protein n=1 Tax=Trichostrongylus colubriformis TaxID=6319 RepID=A0AAN8FT92_TRICO